MKATVNFEN